METAEERVRRLLADYSKALPRVFGNPMLQGIGMPDPRLTDESTGHIAAYALGYVQELAARVHQHCSDEKLTSEEKQQASQLLVNIACQATALMNRLAGAFRLSFREIAEESASFPCLFPAHAGELRFLQKIMWNDFNLGKRHPLKLRPARGRKTFSFETWVNQLLIHYIGKLNKVAWAMVEIRAAGRTAPNAETDIERVVLKVPLTPENGKQWLDVIWQLLLIDMPSPEKHQRLRQLGGRPSRKARRLRRDGTIGEKTQSHNVRASIKEKLGVYLTRLLTNPAPHK
jgi:hypothetical protein